MRNFNVEINSEGRITFKSEQHKYLFTKFLKTFAGKPVSITVKDLSPKRSVLQNNYYHSYITLIAEETGHTHTEIHEWCKGACLPSTIKEVFGDPVRIKQSTTQLTKGEFVEFIRTIEAKTGIAAPDPADYYLALAGDREVEYPEGDLAPKF